MPWPVLQAWSAGKPQFHSFPWSDSTQSHSPAHKYHKQEVEGDSYARVHRNMSANWVLIYSLGTAYMTGGMQVWFSCYIKKLGQYNY